MSSIFHFYAISVQTDRVVATEVEPAEAAVLLDAAHSILLAAQRTWCGWLSAMGSH